MRRHGLIIACAAILVVAGFTVATFVAGDTAGAQVQTTEETTTGETTTGPGAPAESLDDVFWKIFLLAALVALVWSVPFMLDVVLAYRSNARRLDRLIPEFHRVVTEASKRDLTLPELRELVRAADLTYRPARGMSGMTRSLFAFAVLATISTVLFALIALGRPDDDDIVQSIVAALVGAFTTIVGVYYGSRTSESATETAALSASQSGLTRSDAEGSGDGDTSAKRGDDA